MDIFQVNLGYFILLGDCLLLMQSFCHQKLLDLTLSDKIR